MREDSPNHLTQQAAENRPAKLKRVRENRMASIKRKIHRSKKRLSFTDLVSTEPGSLAGRYMRRFWHPVHRAEDLMPGQAKPIQIMSERFTLYRGEGGAPHVVGFRCAHRGTQLSAGWVEGDCIRCIYHGWVFDESGQCIEQPAEEKSFAQKIRIPSYPTREYLGLIFAYFGDGEPPPLTRYWHMEEEGVLEVLSTMEWPCNFFQRMDNNGDTAHVPFVHRGAYSSSSANRRSGIPRSRKKKVSGVRRRTRLFQRAGPTFFTSSCRTPMLSEIPRPTLTCRGKIGCNG